MGPRTSLALLWTISWKHSVNLGHECTLKLQGEHAEFLLLTFLFLVPRGQNTSFLYWPSQAESSGRRGTVQGSWDGDLRPASGAWLLGDLGPVISLF